MKIDRRKFIYGITSIFIGASLGIPAVKSIYSEMDYARDLLHKSLGNFKITDEDLNDFLADWRTHNPHDHDFSTISGRYIHALSKQFPASSLIPKNIKKPSGLAEAHLIEMFLLSTNIADDNRSPDQFVKYEYYADPWVAGCANRFAKFGDI